MKEAITLDIIPALGLKDFDVINKTWYHFIIYMPDFLYCIKISLN